MRGCGWRLWSSTGHTAKNYGVEIGTIPFRRNLAEVETGVTSEWNAVGAGRETKADGERLRCATSNCKGRSSRSRSQAAVDTRSAPSPRTLLRHPVETTHNVTHWDGEQAADAKQGPERYGLSGFDLLPIPYGVSVGNHIFLAKPGPLTQRLDACSQALEESGFVLHDLFVSDPVL